MRAYVDNKDKRSEIIIHTLKKSGYKLLSKNLIKDCSLVYLGLDVANYYNQKFKVNANVYSLVFSKRLEEQCKECGANYYCLSNDKEFIYQNTLFTIEGLVGFLISSEKQSIHDNVYLILGYGNLGKQAYKILKAFEAKVIIATDNIEEMRELDELCVPYTSLSSDYSSTITVIINTIPASVINKLYSHIKIYDLASKPYGIEKVTEDLYYLRLNSLPTYYHTPLSGQMIANIIMKRDGLSVKE